GIVCTVSRTDTCVFAPSRIPDEQWRDGACEMVPARWVQKEGQPSTPSVLGGIDLHQKGSYRHFRYGPCMQRTPHCLTATCWPRASRPTDGLALGPAHA